LSALVIRAEVFLLSTSPGTDSAMWSNRHPRETLKDIGIDASGHQPKGLEDLDPGAFDRVVTMEPCVAKKFSQKFPLYSAERLTKWNVNDPYGDNPAEYRECAIKIHTQLKAFLRALA
jgi:protein-tyrosine-phosphatase